MRVGVGLRVGELDGVPVMDRDEVALAVTVKVGVMRGVCVSVRVRVAVGVNVGVTQALPFTRKSTVFSQNSSLLPVEVPPMVSGPQTPTWPPPPIICQSSPITSLPPW